MTSRRAESTAMALARSLGMESVAWSLRRLHCPVDHDALVLEVGSGGNPYARANVLLDAYPDTRERHWAPLTVDRPFVFGLLEKLPFRDKSFDFVIASHVLEHSTAPERALAEMQRVARAGYIEVPDAFMERVNPYKDHRAEITVRDGRLRIRKKPDWIVDDEVVELYEARTKPLFTRRVIPSHPFAFHVRYYWEERIDFEVVNPVTNAAWTPPADDRPGAAPAPGNGGWRAAARALLRRGLSQTARNRRLDLAALVACPTCGHQSLSRAAAEFVCPSCAVRYPDRNGLPWLYPMNRLNP